MLVKPHGGRLVNRVLNEKEAQRMRRADAPRVQVSRELLVDIRNIANGVFSPLEGFLVTISFIIRGWLTAWPGPCL